MTADTEDNDENEAVCPECNDDLLIHPVRSEHTGLIECDRCQTVVGWNSPMGTTEWEFTKIRRPNEQVEE